MPSNDNSPAENFVSHDSSLSTPVRGSKSPDLEPNIALEAANPKLAAARYWTTVTDNEAFLSHLLSVWYKWEYSYYHFFDWDIFIEDMVAGRKNFCSSLLVNAVLASACVSKFLLAEHSCSPGYRKSAYNPVPST